MAEGQFSFSNTKTSAFLTTMNEKMNIPLNGSRYLIFYATEKVAAEAVETKDIIDSIIVPLWPLYPTENKYIINRVILGDGKGAKYIGIEIGEADIRPELNVGLTIYTKNKLNCYVVGIKDI